MAEGPQDVLGTSPHSSRLNAFKLPRAGGVGLSASPPGEQGGKELPCTPRLATLPSNQLLFP